MGHYTGIGASSGIGIGNVTVIKEQKLEYSSEPVENKTAELTRFKNAVSEFCNRTMKMSEDIKERVGEKEAMILQGQVMMISDPSMATEIESLINSGQCAEAAVVAVCDMFIQVFSGVDDEMMRQRTTDIADIKTRMLKILLGVEDIDIAGLPEGTVLVAADLTPSMTAGINKDNIVGIITETGGKTSHSAILARALEIPAVLSVENITHILRTGDTAIVDGTNGDIYKNPNESRTAEYSKKRREYLDRKKALEKYKGRPTVTKDGKTLMLFGNIGNSEDAVKVLECDGEGVGLFRTEFLFMGKESLPDENEQFEAYKKAAEIMNGKSVIIRTLDVGGDKDIPYLGLEKEENPFMGYRAIRFCLDRGDVYDVQLRALLRASAYGDIKIMIPLVTCVDEIRAVKAKIQKLKKELDEEKIPYNKDIEVGVMIETPAAALIADLLAKEADFFSIGTNDLTGYTMAVDRGNSKVSYLYSAFNPAVLRSIKHIIACGNAEGITVGMCGEAAADPLMIPLLVSFGLDEFSVSAASVLSARREISRWSKEEADIISEKALGLPTEKEVTDYLKKAIE